MFNSKNDKNKIDLSLAIEGFIHEKSRIDLVRKIWKKIVDKNFHVSHHHHYTFLIDNESHTYSIVSLVEIFGDRLFFMAEAERSKNILNDN